MVLFTRTEFRYFWYSLCDKIEIVNFSATYLNAKTFPGENAKCFQGVKALEELVQLPESIPDANRWERLTTEWLMNYEWKDPRIPGSAGSEIETSLKVAP